MTGLGQDSDYDPPLDNSSPLAKLFWTALTNCHAARPASPAVGSRPPGRHGAALLGGIRNDFGVRRWLYLASTMLQSAICFCLTIRDPWANRPSNDQWMRHGIPNRLGPKAMVLLAPSSRQQRLLLL